MRIEKVLVNTQINATNFLGSTSLSREIQNRIHWDMVVKNTASAPALFLLSILLAYYKFDLPSDQFAIQMITVLIAINTFFRWLSGVLSSRNTISKKLAVRFLIFSAFLNMGLWSYLFSLCFNQVKPDSYQFASIFVVMIGLAVSSVLSVSHMPWLALVYQTLLCAPVFISCYGAYREEAKSSYLFLAVTILVLMIFLGIQTISFYREMRFRFTGEIELERSLEKLRISNERIILETGRAENSARMAALGEMSGGIAHEINNPLAIVSASLEQALRLIDSDREWSVEDLKVRLQRAEKSANRISKVIKSMRNISHSGAESEVTGIYSLDSIINDTLDLSRERFKLENISLVVGEIPNLRITTKLVPVSQVLLNLLNNAFDAVKADLIEEKEIRIYFSVNKLEVKVSIENSGPAISAAVQEKLFQPFFTTKEIGKGTGLGLSICKGLVESCGGKIWFEKELSRTTFSFTLPLGATTG